MNHPTQEQFEAALINAGMARPSIDAPKEPSYAEVDSISSQGWFRAWDKVSSIIAEFGDSPKEAVMILSEYAGLVAHHEQLRSEPPAERRDCDEPILGVPRG